MSSGLLSVGLLIFVGMVIRTAFCTTGTVMMKMMSKTNMMSTSGIMLISAL